MKNLLIIGARGWGREVFNIAKCCISDGLNLSIKGFLDDKLDALDDLIGYPPIISSVEDYVPEHNDVFICALGNPKFKKIYSDNIIEKGGAFINLVHPNSHIGDNVNMGQGCIISYGTCIGQDVSLGSFVTTDGYACIGHDCEVKNYCHIGTMSSLGGFVSVGEMVTIHPGVRIVPKVKIGNNAIVGVGGVVIKKVKNREIVFGNPAKVIDHNEE